MKKFTWIILFVAQFFGSQLYAFKFSDVWKVEVGMTKPDVIRLLGSPNQVVPRAPGAGGDEAWLWVDSGLFRRKSVTIVFTGDRVSQVPPRGKVISEKEWQAQGQEGLERAKAVQAAQEQIDRKEFAESHPELDANTKEGLVSGTVTVVQAKAKLEQDRIVAEIRNEEKKRVEGRTQRDLAFQFRAGQSFSAFAGKVPPPGPDRPFDWVWLPRITNQMPSEKVTAIMGEPSAVLTNYFADSYTWVWHFAKGGKTNLLTVGFVGGRVHELPIGSVHLDEQTQRLIDAENTKIEGSQYAAKHPEIDADLKDGLMSGRLSVIIVEIEQESRIRKRNYLAAHPNLKPAKKKDIIESQVKIGMTKDEVEACWGRPRNVNKTVNTLGTHDQWVYGSTYAYFENGILTTIQTVDSFER